MKKLFVVFGFLFCSVFCFAAGEKYRYIMITEQAFMITDLPAALPEEVLNDKCISVNTKHERLQAEAGVRNIEHFFYSGGGMFIYVDYTKNAADPDMSYIDTWSDVLAYVRGTK